MEKDKPDYTLSKKKCQQFLSFLVFRTHKLHDIQKEEKKIIFQLNLLKGIQIMKNKLVQEHHAMEKKNTHTVGMYCDR